MKKYKNFTVEDYLSALSRRTPTPGGGSAAACAGALGAGLLGMVAEYSIGKNADQRIDQKIQKILKQSETARQRFLDLVDEDAEAYLRVVAVRHGTDNQKKAAAKAAKAVSIETCKLSSQTVQQASYLVRHGSKYLISDVEIAVELLAAAFNGAKALQKQ